MKSALIAFMVTLWAFFLVWGAFGFMAWDWDPAEWSSAGRGACLFFSLAAAVVGVLQLKENGHG